MSGRDFGRGGGRGGFGGRGGGFGDRDNRGGSFGDRDSRNGGFRDRDGGGGRGRDGGAPNSRPWERRDEERPARPSGDRPFDRPAGPPQERDVRVERYNEAAEVPPAREERFGADRPSRFDDRAARFGNPRDAERRPGRDAAPAPRSEAPRPAERPAPAPTTARVEEPKGAAAAAARPTPQGWNQAHLVDSWNDEEKLKSWTPSNQDQQEMVEDNIEADPQIPGRDQRAITVRAKSGIVTLTGTVRSRAVKFAASSDAYWTYGVHEVRNELEIQSRMARATATSAPRASAPATARESATEAREAGMTAPNTDATEALEEAVITPEEVATPENDAAVDAVLADTLPSSDNEEETTSSRL